jgi:hypothetical protein
MKKLLEKRAKSFSRQWNSFQSGQNEAGAWNGPIRGGLRHSRRQLLHIVYTHAVNNFFVKLFCQNIRIVGKRHWLVVKANSWQSEGLSIFKVV